ncbi:hypothetical protein [Mycobacteroides chelonae]|uniref:hypothetical protein n=1 Tax=Mycobacteroides chelonae TaxID=1774 RepID=UPI001041D212|nr:hypothetical protein [Mycobacteroides chelonae]
MGNSSEALLQALDALYRAVLACDYEGAQRAVDEALALGATEGRVFEAAEFAVHVAPGGLMDLDELRFTPAVDGS